MSSPSGDSSLPAFSPATARAVTIASEVLVALIAFLFALIGVLFLVYLYSIWRMRRFSRARRQQNAGADVEAAIDPPPCGLDRAALQKLPITVYNKAEVAGEALECAVCLSEITDGEEIRLLPKCGHGFHVGCIDVWLQSHSSCPLCRVTVAVADSPAPAPALPVPVASPREAPRLPTNVLFWGTQGSLDGASRTGAPAPEEGSSSSSPSRKPSGLSLMIDVATVTDEEARPSPSARLHALRRLWSRGRVVDVEQAAAAQRTAPPVAAA